MKTQKHTPGPWAIETQTKGFEVCTMYGVERQPTEDGLGQSWVYVRPESLVRDGEWHWPNEAEQLANARLIAAAPDMLDALKFALQTMERVDGENDCSKAIFAVEAAIAKAEGGAS